MNTTDPDRCTEVLADGTIYTFSINHSTDHARRALEQLHQLQDQEPDFDFVAAVFALFVDSIEILSDSGWTTDELVQEVLDRSDPDPRDG